MNIETTNIPKTTNEQPIKSTNQQQNDTSANFAEELKELKKSDKNDEKENQEINVSLQQEEAAQTPEKSDISVKTFEQIQTNKENLNNKSFANHEQVLSELSSVINKLNQSEDKNDNRLKNMIDNTDNDIKEKHKGELLINNDFNIQELKDKLPQMNSNMNFSGDGQPFSSFMKNEEIKNADKKLSVNAKDLEEEAAILSTMAENVAIANKVNAVQKSDEPREKIVQKNDSIKKVDTKTGITKETIVKYDTVIMNEADVEVFANLVENGEVNIHNLAPESMKKSVHVSKTLADMLAKSMEDNKPVRIEFDNGISVIIKISRDGKLSADFLPSTQVAEAYLKENLPLLKQRFDEQNIEYDELNQRGRREQDRQNQRKKDRNNE